MISDKRVKSFNKIEYKPRKVKSPLTNVVTYDIETLNTIKDVPYANCIYRQSKIFGKNIRDVTEHEYEKCKKDCIVFKGLEKTNEMLDYALQLKENLKKSNIKVLNIYFIYLLIKAKDSIVMLY